jgi:hypothetical protein
MATVSALVSGLDAELRRLGYKDSTLVWYRGCWRPKTPDCSTGSPTCEPHREGTVHMDALCAALDPWPCPGQTQQADAAHNPALLIGAVMFS